MKFEPIDAVGVLDSPESEPVEARPSQRWADEPDARHDEPMAPLSLRRWDASQTHRLNKAHWSRATGRPINEDLAGDLKTLRARCTYEATTNPLVEGVIDTFSTDFVGEDGPSLEVQSDNERYNSALEDIWKETASQIDANGEMSLAEMLEQFVWLWFCKGEHLAIETNAIQPTTFVRVRWLSIDPMRLDTDPMHLGNPMVALGVRRTRKGRPLAYQIEEPEYHGPFQLFSGVFIEYSADVTIHQFRRFEPGQVRGVPWLASCLQTTADLRDFDEQVLDAARLAASQGVVWFSDHPDIEPLDRRPTSPMTTVMERNIQQTGPPGWKPMMVNPAQPQNNYVDYRAERLRDLGRPVSMPLMKVLLSSEKSNFSGSRMDYKNYESKLQKEHGRTERVTLNPMVNRVAQEAAMVSRPGVGFILPPRPRKVEYVWTWRPQPQFDAAKESVAEERRLTKTRTQTFAGACAEHGVSEDQVIRSWARSIKKMQQAGLPDEFIATLLSPRGTSQRTPEGQGTETAAMSRAFAMAGDVAT